MYHSDLGRSVRLLEVKPASQMTAIAASRKVSGRDARIAENPRSPQSQTGLVMDLVARLAPDRH